MKPVTLDTNTILAILGLAGIGLGVALVFLPAAFIVVGALVLAYAIIPDQSGGSK